MQEPWAFFARILPGRPVVGDCHLGPNGGAWATFDRQDRERRD